VTVDRAEQGAGLDSRFLQPAPHCADRTCPGIPTPSAPSCFGRLNRTKALYSNFMGSSRTIMNAMRPTILSWVLSRSRSLLRSYSSRGVARLISPIIALSSCLLSHYRRI
jgi:hypothetical protein